jgi:hypothetical protein
MSVSSLDMAGIPTNLHTCVTDGSLSDFRMLLVFHADLQSNRIIDSIFELGTMFAYPLRRGP